MKNRLVNLFFSQRLKEIDFFRLFPEMAQATVFRRLMGGFANCEYGKKCAVTKDMSYEDFRVNVPVVTYEEYQCWIEKSFKNKLGVVSDEDVLWYSKSSGTTSSKSKFIPVTQRYLKKGHLIGGRDTLAITMDNYPKNGLLNGKALTLGGSIEQNISNDISYSCGDISAIMMSNTPWYAKRFRAPSLDVAITKNFKEKVEKICKECSTQNITSFAGVPSWNLVMMEKILEYNGKQTIPEVWKNIELFTHGGVSFEPYREQYNKLFPNPNMKYVETYNASEGFFGIQDIPNSEDMLLMCDYDIFYEFMPMSRYGDESSIVPIEGVKKDVNYAMIISTSAGLWRYLLGDTVKFTSLTPHRIKITGRTKLFLNVFGEEVVIENSNTAIVAAAKETKAIMSEYMVTPIFMEIGSRGAHQWIVEFSKLPVSFENFAKKVDKTLQEINSDYEAKRFDNTTLDLPQFVFVEKGAFYNWYDSKGIMGGQNKIPRLSNFRELADEFLLYVEKNNLIVGHYTEK